MERVEGLKDDISSVFFYRSKRPHAIFHIYSTRPFPIDTHLLPEREIQPINAALATISISSVDVLNSGVDRGEIGNIIYGRVGAIIDNLVKVRLLQLRENYYPEVVACGESGAYNACIAAGMISLEQILSMIKAESRAIADGRKRYSGGMFKAQISSTTDQQVRSQILEEMESLEAQGFYIRPGEQESVKYLGISAGYPDDNLDYLRQVHPKTQFSILKNPDAPLHTPLIEPCLKGFRDVLAKITIADITGEPRIVVVGGRGEIIRTPEEIKQELSRQTITSSNRELIRKTLRRAGISKLHEIGLESAEGDHQDFVITAALFAAGVACGILGLHVIQKKMRY